MASTGIAGAIRDDGSNNSEADLMDMLFQILPTGFLALGFLTGRAMRERAKACVSLAMVSGSDASSTAGMRMPDKATMAMRIVGYAALFNQRDAGGDIIRPGAFRRTLAARLESEISDGGLLPLFWQHNPELRVGWVLSASEDEHGLCITASIDDPLGGAAAAVKAGKVTGLSFGYRARQFTREAAGRDLHDVDLFEVSLVTNPMQSGARVISISAPSALSGEPV